jgi:hypothetical protein
MNSQKSEPAECDPFGFVLVDVEEEQAVMFYSPDMKPNPEQIKNKFEPVPVFTAPQPCQHCADFADMNDEQVTLNISMNREINELQAKVAELAQESDSWKSSSEQWQISYDDLAGRFSMTWNAKTKAELTRAEAVIEKCFITLTTLSYEYPGTTEESLTAIKEYQEWKKS